MPESHSFFTKMVDELIEFSEYDPELSDGIKWLDEQAQKKGLSFYDMVFHVLYKHDINTKAKEWLHSRNWFFMFCISMMLIQKQRNGFILEINFITCPFFL